MSLSIKLHREASRRRACFQVKKAYLKLFIFLRRKILIFAGRIFVFLQPTLPFFLFLLFLCQFFLALFK